MVRRIRILVLLLVLESQLRLLAQITLHLQMMKATPPCLI